MKFDAAIAFVLSGITLYFIARAQEGEFDKAQVVISVTFLQPWRLTRLYCLCH